MTQYRVLHIATEEAIANDPIFYGGIYKTDSEEFPDLQASVGDDYDLFVIDISSGTIFPADEFFSMTDVLEFIVTKEGTPF